VRLIQLTARSVNLIHLHCANEASLGQINEINLKNIVAWGRKPKTARRGLQKSHASRLRSRRSRYWSWRFFWSWAL